MASSGPPPREEPTLAPAVYRVQETSIDASNALEVRSPLVRTLYLHGPILTVDLGRVTFIDSTGLGMLVGVHREARELEGRLRLGNAGPEVQRILQVTGLNTLFEAEGDAVDVSATHGAGNQGERGRDRAPAPLPPLPLPPTAVRG